MMRAMWSRRRRYGVWALCFLSAAFVAGCDVPSPAKQSGGSKAGDIADQLNQVRDELRQLRQETAAVREAVREIHRAAVTPPSAALPKPQTAEVVLDADDPVLGSPEAGIAIVEFSDYECPFCVRYHSQTFAQIKERYIDTGKVRYISRDFPLGFHPNARSASIAANCANEQDKYKVMKDALYAGQRRLGAELYSELATTLGLDTERFSVCMKNVKNDQEIDSDSSYGQSLGVTGTPTFFVGRVERGRLVDAKRIVGAQPFTAFSKVIESYLAGP